MMFVVTFKPANKNELEILVFDVGNADSFLIKTPENKYIMIDTAHGALEGSSSGFSQADSIMNKYLKDNGIKTLDILLLTHFDSDHSGGAVDVMKTVNVKKLVINKNKDDSKTTKNIFNYLKNNKIPNSIAQNNTLVFEENNLKFKTYTPNINSKNDNDTSIITLLSYKDFDMLFMADAGVKSFENIKKNLNNNDIEILKSGHHGADNTVSKSMLKSINPDAAIISTGFNPYGHPSKQTLKTFETAKIKTYRTDIDNAIKITSDGNSYEIYRYNTNSKKFEEDMQNLCVNPQSR